MAAISASVGKGGENRRNDVEIIQNLINQNIRRLVPLAPLVPDGFVGVKTIFAIEEFQRRVMRMPIPDGRVDPGGRTLVELNGGSKTPSSTITFDTTKAPWIAVGRGEVGIKESRGLTQNNPRILEYISTFPYLQNIWREDRQALMGDVDETPWCACFVNWCLIRAGKRAGPSARARDWLTYGTHLSEPRPGAVTVVYHTPGRSTAGTTSSGYHVAFYVSGDGLHSITLLGGNQSDRVSEHTYRGYWTVQGYRWPA